MLTLASDYGLLALFGNRKYIHRQVFSLSIAMSYVIWAFVFATGVVFSVDGSMIVLALIVATLQTADAAFLTHFFQQLSCPS
jgi:hypothetical protein